MQCAHATENIIFFFDLRSIHSLKVAQSWFQVLVVNEIYLEIDKSKIMMKRMVFESSFSNLEDHVICCEKYWLFIDQNGAFLHAPLFRDTLYLCL